jgi:excisionase family DNA binding protein
MPNAFDRRFSDAPSGATGEEEIDEARLLTVNDVAQLLHVPVSWVYQHTRRRSQHRIPFLKIGRYVRFRKTDLKTYLDLAARIGS